MTTKISPSNPNICLTCNELLSSRGFGLFVCKNGCVQPARCIKCSQITHRPFSPWCDPCTQQMTQDTPQTDEPACSPGKRMSSRTANKKQPTQNRPPPNLGFRYGSGVHDKSTPHGTSVTSNISNTVTQQPPSTIPPNIRFSREQKCIACNYSWLMNVDATVHRAVRHPEYIDCILKCNDCFQAQLRYQQPPTPVTCCVCNSQTANYELNQLTVRHWVTSSVPIPLAVSCKDCIYGTDKSQDFRYGTDVDVRPRYDKLAPHGTHKFGSSSNSTTSNINTSAFSVGAFGTTRTCTPEEQANIRQTFAEPLQRMNQNFIPNVFLKNSPKDAPAADDDALIKLIMNKVFGIDKIAVFDPMNRYDGCDTEDEDDGPVAKSRAMDTTPDERADWPFEWIGDVNTIADLIRLGKTYKPDTRVITNLDTEKLVRLVEPLERLDAMVGLAAVKTSIFHQIIFHLQGLDEGLRDMHHTVIKGPPGVGKTEIAHRLAEIYNAIGILKTSKVVSVKRDDLIAGYVGQTALKTKKKLEEALGGVLLIDEAYSLGDGSDKDTFSKEAVDLLTSYLSEHGTEFICVIAGYKEALEKRFFNINEGLARRFTIHYEIKPYEGPELQAIFKKTVNDGGWNLADDTAAPVEFFTEHKDDFPSFGGDMLNLFASVKKAHSRRLLSIRTKAELDITRRQISYSDLQAGFASFKDCNGYKKDEKNELPAGAMHMYN